jgi:hypothetical protein
MVYPPIQNSNMISSAERGAEGAEHVGSARGAEGPGGCRSEGRAFSSPPARVAAVKLSVCAQGGVDGMVF